MYTPWSIDTYQLFSTDMYEEQEIEWYNEQNETSYTYDDFDWSLDHEGYVKQLAANWLDLVRDNIIDDVILSIDPDGDPWSPRYYNYGTDNQNIHFTVDYDALKKYIADNQSDYDADKIKSSSGFVWLGDDDETMLQYYLNKKSGTEYSDESYMYDQFDLLHGNGQIGEFISFELIKKD